MGRARTGIELITDKKMRLVTFEKRRRGLEKKAQELSTLCGVRICFIIFGPKDNDKPTDQPKIWPENPEEIVSLIESYKKVANLDDGRSRTTDLSSFYKDRMRKAEEDLAKLRKKNLVAKQPTWDERYDSLSLEDLRQLYDLLKAKLEAMKARVEFLAGTSQNYLAETSGTNMMRINSSYENNSNTNLCSLYLPMQQQQQQQQPPMLASFDPNGPISLDVGAAFQNSYNFNSSMLHPQMMLLMNNNGASTSNNPVISYDFSDHKSPSQFMMDPAAAPAAPAPAAPAPAEYYVSGLGNNNNAVGNQFCYYTMQSMPLYVQYPLQNSTAPSQTMNGSQTDNENYGLSDFQLMNPK